MIFTDLGVVTTTAATGPALTRTMLSEMTQDKPDVVVFELGDGILGAYGVEAILSAPDIRRVLSAVILSANDPVAAWGGVKLLRERFDIEPCAVTGPATDNAVGVRIIEEQMGVRARNALTSGAELGDHILESLGLGSRRAGGERMRERTPAIVRRHRLCRGRVAAAARRASATRPGRRCVRQPARNAGRAVLPAPAARVAASALRGARRDRRVRRRQPGDGSAVRCATVSRPG